MPLQYGYVRLSPFHGIKWYMYIYDLNYKEHTRTYIQRIVNNDHHLLYINYNEDPVDVSAVDRDNNPVNAK